VRLGFADLAAEVGDVERHVDEAHAEFARLLELGVCNEGRPDGRGNAPMPPRNHSTLGIEPGIDALGRDRVQIIVVKVVLARPRDLDRSAAHLARQQRRLEHKVWLRLAAETAAEQGDVDRHILRFEAQLLDQLVLRAAGTLHRRPNLAFAAGDAGRRASRLHWGVSDMRRVVFREHRLRGRPERLLGIAFIAYNLARFARGFLQLGLVGSRIVTGVRPVIPLDDERLTPLNCRPGVASNDRDAADRLELRRGRGALDDDDLLDARHLHRRAAVIGRELAAHDWRAGDDGVFHARDLGVDAVDRAAGRDVEQIDNRDIAFPKIAE
jgi:hypothetical protein